MAVENTGVKPTALTRTRHGPSIWLLPTCTADVSHRTSCWAHRTFHRTLNQTEIASS